MGLSPAWLLRKFIPEGGFYEFVGGVVAISFVYLFWLAGARWPTSSGVARFGFAIGLAAFNYLAVLYSMFILRALIYGL